jgi:ribosome-associated protein
MDAVAEAKRITNFEGRRRQMQFIGKLMRKLDDEDIEAIREALRAQHSGSAKETLALHQAEQWRDRLLQSDDAVAEWMAAYPATDSQQLRAMVRQARKDNTADKTTESQGLAPRQGRSYREIFQLVKQTLQEAEDAHE